MSSSHAQNHEADISALQDEIKRLQVDLRRTQDANREISERNKQLAATKKIPDSVVAPKPFLGNTKEQDPNDWLLWFDKYCQLQKNERRRKEGFILMMLQGPASDWVTGWLEGAVYTPTYHSLKKAFEENYYKAKELKWKDASALWHEKQGSSESVSQYIVRMKKLARNLEFSPEILHMAIMQGFRPAIRNQVIQKDTSNFDELVKTARLS
jgi:hypothetical protein